MNRIDLIVGQMASTRHYTLRILEHTPRHLWFVTPPAYAGQGGFTPHIGWHVGHLCFAEYAHFIQMICGETDADTGTFPKERIARACSKGTTPAADAGLYPTPDELLELLASLHAHCRSRFAGFADAELDKPTIRPHQIAVTRFDMAMWWIKHEMLHAGQIALLRRLHGLQPWR